MTLGHQVVAFQEHSCPGTTYASPFIQSGPAAQYCSQIAPHQSSLLRHCGEVEKGVNCEGRGTNQGDAHGTPCSCGTSFSPSTDRSYVRAHSEIALAPETEFLRSGGNEWPPKSWDKWWLCDNKYVSGVTTRRFRLPAPGAAGARDRDNNENRIKDIVNMECQPECRRQHCEQWETQRCFFMGLSMFKHEPDMTTAKDGRVNYKYEAWCMCKCI